MRKPMHNIELRQLDDRVGKLREIRGVFQTRTGWIKTLRTALGMSGAQLGRRLGVSQPAVSQLEKAEMEGTISVENLRRAASALECDLLYALVPRHSLQTTLVQQAHKAAAKMASRVSHSMDLEQQLVSDNETASQVQDLANELVANRSRLIWDEE